MTVSPSLQPPAAARAHISASRGERCVARGAGHHPAQLQTARDLPAHEGPAALRKPILLLPLYQGCLLAAVREGGGGRMGEKGKEGGQEQSQRQSVSQSGLRPSS